MYKVQREIFGKDRLAARGETQKDIKCPEYGEEESGKPTICPRICHPVITCLLW